MCLATLRIVAVFMLLFVGTVFRDRARAAEDVNNAAAIYLKSLERLPGKGSTESDFLNDADAIQLQGPVVRFLMSHDETGQSLHAAAQRGRCDWPAGPDPSLLLKVLRLSDLERMRVRWAVEEERFDDAILESSDAMVFGRFVGRMPASISRGIAAGITDWTTTWVATCLPVVSDQALAELQKRLKDLPRWFTASEVIEGDGKRIVVELQRLDAMKRPDLFAKSSILYELTGGDYPDDAAARTQIKALWDDPAKRSMAIAGISARYADAAKIVAMPRMQIAKAIEAWDQKRQKADALTRSVLPSGRVLQRTQILCLISDVRAAMLQAALTGRISGTDAAMKILDPSTGKPFKLREWEEGFELQSDLVDLASGKPLKLLVGKAEKVPF